MPAQIVVADVVPGTLAETVSKDAVRLPHAAAKPKHVVTHQERHAHGVLFQADVVFRAGDLLVTVAGGVRVGAVVRVVIVERVVPVRPEGAEIRRVGLRHLYRAEDVPAHGEVVVGHLRALVGVSPRVDVAPGLHIGLQRHIKLVKPAVPVRLRRGVVGQLPVGGGRIVALRVRHLQRVAKETDVLEVVPGLVVPVVLHPPDEALAVGVGPGVFRGIVVKRVFEPPPGKLAGGKVIRPRPQRRPGVLVQVALVVGDDDHVKGVALRHTRVVQVSLRPDRAQIVAACDDRLVVRDAILHPRHKLPGIPQRFQSGIGGLRHRRGFDAQVALGEIALQRNAVDLRLVGEVGIV